MRNIILVTKFSPSLEGSSKCFVDISKIVAVGFPIDNVAKLYFDNAIWYIPAEEFKEVMSVWAPYYSTLESYKKLVSEN